MNASDDAPTPWWGSVSLDEGTGGRWHIGPSTLWVYRSSHDWRIMHRPSDDPVAADPMARRSEWTVPLPSEELNTALDADAPDITTHRYSVRSTAETVALRPALADRPVIARPEHPLSVVPGESVTLYLSTPLWIQIELVESERTLQEVPSHRMSDTWFGHSTLEGELCYATRTSGRLHRSGVPLRLHRALTPLQVHNDAAEPLALERVQLPARHLSLYHTADDGLWTEAVTMRHRTARKGADVRIEEGAPADAAGAPNLRAPRDTDQQGLFTSTFGTIGGYFGL